MRDERPRAVWRWCLALWAGILLWGPQAAASPDPKERMAQAIQHTRDRAYGKAISIYESLVEEGGPSRKILGRLVPLYFIQGKYDRAIRRLGPAIRKDPKFAKGHYFQAYALRKLGRHKEALAAYRSYRRLRPRDPNPLYGMAISARALGKDARAVAHLEKFLAMAASKEGKQAKRLEPWLLRARASLKTIRQRQAEAKSNAAVQAAVRKARAAAGAGEPLKAEKILKAALEKQPKAVLLARSLASLLIRLRRCGEAIGLLRQVLKEKPGSMEPRYHLALCLRMTGQMDEAARAYRAVIRMKADHPDAHFGLAETLRKQGKLQEALRLYRRYVAIEQRPEEQRWVTKARAHIARIEEKIAAREAPRRPAAATRPAADPDDLSGITDPRIRAMLEARRRFRQRQRGETPKQERASPASPRRSAAPAKDRAAERRRRRAQARKERAEARRRRIEEARRKRAEARKRRIEEARKRREALLAKRRRRRNEALARRLLGGRDQEMTPEIRAILLEWAKAAGDKGEHDKALRIWKLISGKHPEDKAILSSLAAAALAAGDPRIAVAAYRKLIKLSPRKMDLYRKLRSAEAKAGMPRTALPMALVLPEAILKGREALRAVQPERALALARQRLEADPGNGPARVLEADALFHLGKHSSALAAAREAARKHPSLAGPHRIIGHYHLRQRDRGAALGQYRRFMQKAAKDSTEAPYVKLVKMMIRRLER